MFLKKIIKNIIYIFFAPIVLVIYFVKPLLYIKFFKLSSTRIGPFITNIEMIMYAEDQINEIKNKKIIYYLDKSIANTQIKKMAKRFLSVSSNYMFYNILCQAIVFWGMKKNHILSSYYFSFPNILSISPKWYEQSKIYLNFNSEEKKRGLELLENLKIKKEDKWICIQNRDAAYLNKFFYNQGSPKLGKDWRYHNYRDFRVNSLLPAAEFFTKKGFYVIRMGKSVEEKLISKNSKIIDYASSKFRNDFADIFLLLNCKAYFGGSSGIESVPEIAKIPKYNINYPSTDITKVTQMCPWMFIFKRIKSLKTNKLLSIQEILKSDFAYSTNTHDFEKSYVRNIDNSEEDIKSFATEVEKQLRNDFIETQEDQRIQKEFWSIYFRNVNKNKIGHFRPKVSPSFLRNNLDLLN